MITAEQMKAGRALVGLKQEDIANATGLSVQTIKRMETTGTERSSAGNVQAVKRAMEQAGVVFLGDGEMATGGPGVRLAPVGQKSFDTIETEVVQYPEFLKNDAPPGAGG